MYPTKNIINEEKVQFSQIGVGYLIYIKDIFNTFSNLLLVKILSKYYYFTI